MDDLYMWAWVIMAEQKEISTASGAYFRQHINQR